MESTIASLSYDEALSRIAELEAELQQKNTENERLRTFNHLSQKVSTSLSIQEVLETILDEIDPFLTFDSSTLLLVEQDRLRAMAVYGFPKEHLAFNLYPKSNRNSAWQVVDSKLPLIINDVTTELNWESRTGLEAVRAWVGIPLIVKDQVIGVLTFDSHRPHVYTQGDAQLALDLAYQVAFAVENASLFETVKSQRDQMLQLQELNQSIASILDLDSLLQAIMQQITQLLGNHRCSLWLFNQAGQVTMAGAWQAHQSVKKVLAASPSTQPTFEVVRHPQIQQLLTCNEPLIINKVDSFLPEVIVEYKDPKLSLLVMPLRYNEKNIGFIVTDNTEDREAFLPNQLTLAMNAASQAALAISAAKLFDELQKQADRLRLINEVTQEINTILGVDDLFAVLAQVIYERLGYFVVTIFDVDLRTQQAMLRTITGHSPSWLLPHKYEQSLIEGAIGKAVQAGETVLVTDVEQTPTQFLIKNADFRSGIVVPIYINHQLEVLLAVQNERPKQFEDNDVWVLETLSRQAAIAIENIRLYHDATQHLNELAVLYDAGQALVSTLDLDKMLAIIMEQTCHALFAEYGYVLLIDEADSEITVVAAVGGGGHSNFAWLSPALARDHYWLCG